MGIYGKYVLPRLIDLAMRNKHTTRLRSEWVPQARGEVLEIGIGSGLNLPFYSSNVRHIFGVDPSVELQHMGRKKADTVSVGVEFLSQSAEMPLPLGDASIDTVVVTYVEDGRMAYVGTVRDDTKNILGREPLLLREWAQLHADELLEIAGG